MIRKLLPYIVSVILAISIFIAGCYVGIYFFASIKTTTMLQDHFISSLPLATVLNDLDKGEVEKARQFLVLQQDGDILFMSALAENADKQSFETACRVLKHIAKNRQDNPAYYKEYSYGTGFEKADNIKKEVARILNKWSSASCDKNK